MAESEVESMEEIIVENAIRQMQEAIGNLLDAAVKALNLIANAFSQVIRAALDSIQSLNSIGTIDTARVYAAASRKELYYMTRAKKLRVRKKYYNRVKRRIAKR